MFWWVVTGLWSMLGRFVFFFMAVSFSLHGSSFPVQKSGEAFGILASKATAWIEVKEDEGFTHRYLSPWQGSSPTNGGGFDSKVVEKIDELVVGNRVWLSWYWDGHLRIKKIRLVKPKKESGVFAGYLLEKGDKWFDARSEGAKIPWRFYVRWRGGLPENGGGYDTASLDSLDDVDPNLPIRFAWSYDFRPRFDEFLDEEEEEEFVPFYQGRSLKSSAPSLVPPAPIVNPFDLAPQPNPFDSVNSPTNPFQSAPQTQPNPFDQAPQPNPFDAVNKPANPFETAPQAPQTPFELEGNKGGTKPKPVNPFETAPQAPQNPFEDTPLPGNPFESLEKTEP